MDEQSKTPSPPLRILLVDDEPNDRILVQRILEREFSKVEIIQAKDRKDLEQALGEKKIDAAILDYALRWTDGLRLLWEFKERDPELPVIMFTATGSEEVAVEAMKAGLDGPGAAGGAAPGKRGGSAPAARRGDRPGGGSAAGREPFGHSVRAARPPDSRGRSPLVGFQFSGRRAF